MGNDNKLEYKRRPGRNLMDMQTTHILTEEGIWRIE